MKHLAIIALAALVLGACATVAEEGAKIADQKLQTDIWGLCKGNSVGAIDRYFGRTQALANSWRELCHGQDGVDLFSPAGDE
jgi:hypothetical protein